jgi:hypothetical protein
MGKIKSAPLVHPFVAIMFNLDEQKQVVLKHFTERFGNILGCGPVYLVTDYTDYYTEEFGRQLQKQFFVFEPTVSLDEYHRVKVWSNRIETGSEPGAAPRRIVNIDPGYLEPSKLVLFSTKNYSHRVYVADGIFAEVTMLYAHGKFVKLPWTYNDYYGAENLKFLTEMRKQIVKISRRKS